MENFRLFMYGENLCVCVSSSLPNERIVMFYYSVVSFVRPSLSFACESCCSMFQFHIARASVSVLGLCCTLPLAVHAGLPHRPCLHTPFAWLYCFRIFGSLSIVAHRFRFPGAKIDAKHMHRKTSLFQASLVCAYAYVSVCVCVCVCASLQRHRRNNDTEPADMAGMETIFGSGMQLAWKIV